VLRKATQEAAEYPDQKLEGLVPLVGRRVDYVHRMYNRDWREVAGVVLWGEKHFTIDEDELRLLQAIDGKSPIGAIVQAVNGTTDREDKLNKVRRLARRGVIDLVSQH
jgi:hypothetical protein